MLTVRRECGECVVWFGPDCTTLTQGGTICAERTAIVKAVVSPLLGHKLMDRPKVIKISLLSASQREVLFNES
jgi:cytidine deaminase